MNLPTGAATTFWNQRMRVDANETKWIRQIAAGDEDALQGLYAAYGQRLYAYALRLTGEPGLAEEAVQETLIAVWKGAGRFRGEGRVIAWLLGIVHHKALNLIRKKPYERLDDDSAADPVSTDPLPAQHVEWNEQSQLLRQGLDRLSVDHRAALELVFYQGLNLSEAAEVLSCPVGTVKSRLSYAKTALRGYLMMEGLDDGEVR